MDAIVILGSAVWESGPSPTMQRRTRHAFGLWQRDPTALIVPTGGLGRHPPSEAAAMRDLLVAWGVPPAQIALEDASATTLENLMFARPILARRGCVAVTIVSDHYHARRALFVARRLGLRAAFSGPPPPINAKASYRRQQIRELGALGVYAWRLRRKGSSGDRTPPAN